jgi:5-methylcytosine-specific restriction endonuclease McrA
MKRNRISKEKRAKVYAKYGGRCAYCGKEISINDMQIDHIKAFAQSIYGKENDRKQVAEMIDDGSIDDMDNLLPSCRACNYYKNINGIDGFRQRILNQLSHTCIDTFQARLAMQYGIIEYKPWDGEFYFEKIKKNNKQK